MSRVVPIAALAVLGFGVDALHLQRTPEPESFVAPENAPDPRYSKALSMGFETALADYHWIKVVQLVGDPAIDPVAHAEYLGDVIDVVTTLDPWVGHPYRFAAVWLVDSPESVRRANELLRRAIEHHPEDWRNYFYLGFNHFFYLGENEPAADALERAHELPGAPAYLGRLVIRLRSEGTDLQAATVFLQQLVRDTEDPETRAGYQAVLDEIEVENGARIIEQGMDVFRERHGRAPERIEELLEGAEPVFARLPGAEPSSIPQALRRGSRWEIGDDGRVVSTYYGRRYELHQHAIDRERRERWEAEARESDDLATQEGARRGS